MAYSYVDVTIKEVEKYEEAPAKTDTFPERLLESCRQSWSGLLSFLEGCLTFVVLYCWYIALGVAAWLWLRKRQKRKKDVLPETSHGTKDDGNQN